MFRLEYLKVRSHPQLGDLELFISEKNEITNTIKPYTSVIIGPNGTGKSYILRTISEIFRQFQAYSQSEKRELNLPYYFHIRYTYNRNVYEIISSSSITNTKGKEYSYYMNRPIESEIDKGKFGVPKNLKYKISFHEVEFPEKCIVNSVIPTDRFVQKVSTPEDFYQYLGARSTSSTASTKTSVRRTISNIFNASIEKYDFIINLKELLSFLEFEEKLSVQYRTKINKLFFSGQLTKENFKKYYENWWDETFTFSNRNKENPLWSIPYYDKYFKDDELLTEQLIAYLNSLNLKSKRFKKKPKSSSLIFDLNLFDDDLEKNELNIIMHLEKLDIINLEGIRIRKLEKSIGINEMSSGEYHMLISLIGILANIKNNSIVLIDEPEISLHPNWQMGYVSFLKKVFSKFSDCHFIIATHSHFLVSDLEGSSSSVTALSRILETNKLSASLLEGIDTYGWSAEDVLYNVFRVSSTRNYYVALEIGQILKIIAKKEIDILTLNTKRNELERIKASLKPNDPLKSLIDKIQKEFLYV